MARDASTRRDLQSWVQHNVVEPGGVGYIVQGGDMVVHGSHDARAERRIRILMLAANPASTHRLALDEEAREITEKLRLSRDRETFELITRWAVRPADLLQHLNEHNPHIVHFSGHGDRAGELALSADGGGDRLVSAAALAQMFRVMRNDIRVVVLNACHSAVQARAIGRYIDYIVGMRAPIDDRSATIFAAAFYSALGFGRTVREAFAQGTAALMLHGMPDHDVPDLIVRPGAAAHLTVER
jgi:hypothetical protein